MLAIERLFSYLPDVYRDKKLEEKAKALNWYLNCIFQFIVLLACAFVFFFLYPETPLLSLMLALTSLVALGSFIYSVKNGCSMFGARAMLPITCFPLLIGSSVNFTLALPSFVWCLITLNQATFYLPKREVFIWMFLYMILIFVCSSLAPITPLVDLRNFFILYQTQYVMALLILALQIYFYIYTKDQIALQLKETQHELLQKLQENHNLVRILSHDVANPLTVIETTTAQLIRGNSLGEEELKKISRIRNASRNIKNLLNDVRNLQAVIDGKQSLVIKSCPVDEVLEKSINNFTEKLNEKKIKITYKKSDLSILIDQQIFINQVLNNLLSNAIKFSYPETEIFIEAQKVHGAIKINIRDQGVGISSDKLNDLFSLTKSTSSRGTEGEQGTGFGLPIVKNILDLMQGHIQVESKCRSDAGLNSGTTFILTLKETA
jgi:signal transduction histidine kinase